MCTAADDLSVALWSQKTGLNLRVMKGHTNYVMCANFNPLGTLVATGSFDHSVRIWDTEKGSCLYRLSAHSDTVVSAHFNGDGTQLVTAGFDGAVYVSFSPSFFFFFCSSVVRRIWDVKTGRLVKQLHSDPDVPVYVLLVYFFCC